MGEKKHKGWRNILESNQQRRSYTHPPHPFTLRASLINGLRSNGFMTKFFPGDDFCCLPVAPSIPTYLPTSVDENSFTFYKLCVSRLRSLSLSFSLTHIFTHTVCLSLSLSFSPYNTQTYKKVHTIVNLHTRELSHKFLFTCTFFYLSLSLSVGEGERY